MWTGDWFRSSAFCLLASVLWREVFATTSCLLFSTGWALIVRAGNKGKSQQKSMAVNYDTCELAFSTAPLSLVSTQICMVSPDILRSTQSLGLSRKGRLTVLTEKAARSTLYDLVLPLFFRGFSQQPRCP